MKMIVRNLMVLTLFLAPAYAQLPSIPAQSEDNNFSSEPATTVDQVQESSAGEAPKALTHETETQQAKTQEAEIHSSLFRTMGGLGLVIFLMIAVYFAARKFAPRYFAKSTSGKTLKVVETLSMGDKRSISLIEVANNRFLVGNTPQQLNLIAALPDSGISVSEAEALSTHPKTTIAKESKAPFRNLFELEKRRPPQHLGNPLPEDIRVKMRQLRETLER
jgi:flagellar biosynthetic protein FliO